MNNSHPGLPEFDYIKPASLNEASGFLSEHAKEAMPFSGGTDTFVRMRDGVLSPRFLVDIKGFDETKLLSFNPKTGLTIGAAIPMNQVIAFSDAIKTYSLLVDAARSVASYQLRNRATIIGNICNASPAGDTIGACLVFQGVLNVHGKNGLRTVPLKDFFLGPGKTVLTPGDIVLSVQLPVPPKNSVGKYYKLGRNKLSDLSIVALAALGYADETTASGFRFRLALASVAPVPFVPQEAEAILASKKISKDTIELAAVAAMDAVKPIDDVRGSAQYRKLMVRNITRQVVTAIWDKIK
jgi:CO/xanthine dehydrogenase FAD-binding subunit